MNRSCETVQRTLFGAASQRHLLGGNVVSVWGLTGAVGVGGCCTASQVAQSRSQEGDTLQGRLAGAPAGQAWVAHLSRRVLGGKVDGWDAFR